MAKLDPITLKDEHGFSLFDGFPYLITTVTYGGYHFTLLPKGPLRMLYALAFSQYIINDLPQCLVLSHESYWHWPETAQGDGPPLGGTIVGGEDASLPSISHQRRVGKALQEARKLQRKWRRQHPDSRPYRGQPER
jgi:hypothetical protein